MDSMKMDQDQLNQLVVKYLGQVNVKLRDKFCKAANILSEESEGEESGLCLENLVQSYLEIQSEKRKCPESEESEEATNKKPKLDEKTQSVAKKAKQKKMDRKTVFIRNIGKKFNFEKHRGRFEAFGQTHGFTNSGKGFAFLTFFSEEAANTCIETLNSTEIDGQTVQMNIARGHQGKGVSISNKEILETSERILTFQEEEDTTACKVFVHGVKQEVTEKEIADEFSQFGVVVECFNPGKGFAFVTFQTDSEAEAAVNSLNGKKIFGNILNLNISKPKEKPDIKKTSKKDKKKKKEGGSQQSRVFVKNIDKDADMEEMKKLFGAHGSVVDLYNPGKGFIFVSYSNAEEAETAVKSLDGESVGGKIIQCNVAKFKKNQGSKKNVNRP